MGSTRVHHRPGLLTPLAVSPRTATHHAILVTHSQRRLPQVPPSIAEAMDGGESTDKRALKKMKREKRKAREAAELAAAAAAAATENPPESLNVELKVVTEDKNKMSPLVGYFPTGYDPCNDGEPPAKVRVFRNTQKESRLELVVSPNDSKVDFVGTSYTGAACLPQYCTYALGMLDKEAGTLKILPIAANKIFRLEPTLGGSVADAEEPTVVDAASPDWRVAENTRNMTKTYASKAQVKRELKKQALQLDEDMPDLGIERPDISKEALETASKDSSRNIPPHNCSAVTPEMAYPLDKIILKGEWDDLLDILEHVQGGVAVSLSSSSYPSFVCHRFFKLHDIEDEDEKMKLAGIFSYISHLIKFRDQHSMDGVSSAKHHKFPRVLFQKLKMTFTEPAAKWLPDDKRDLLISYVLVLTLIADGFRTDPSDIAKDLRMTVVNLRKYYEHLGCKLVRQNNTTFVTLPVPLQFPKIRARRQK